MSKLSRSIAYAVALDEFGKSTDISLMPYIDMRFDVVDADVSAVDSRISMTINVVDTVLKAPLYNWTSDITINNDGIRWDGTLVEYEDIYSRVSIGTATIEGCFNRESNIFEDYLRRCSPRVHSNLSRKAIPYLGSILTKI